VEANNDDIPTELARLLEGANQPKSDEEAANVRHYRQVDKPE
jgi:hypothetical protein